MKNLKYTLVDNLVVDIYIKLTSLLWCQFGFQPVS